MFDYRFPFTLAIALLGLSAGFAAPPGVLESSTDVGVTPKPGAVDFDAPAGKYRVTGGGANIWGVADAFQFVWKRVSGDVTLEYATRYLHRGTQGPARTKR